MSSTSTLRSKILKMAQRRTSGVTAYDVTTKFSVSRRSASAALAELRNQGFLYITGSKRRTGTGKQNQIYFR